MVSLPQADNEWRQRCQTHFGLPPKTDLMLLAQQQGAVCGVVPVTRMTRLVQDLPKQPAIRSIEELAADGGGVVWFEFTGSSQQGRRPEVRLKVQAVVTLVCQRCMGEMPWLVNESVEFELFASEAALAAAQGAEEVDPDEAEALVASGQVDLLSIVEDQLILAIPYVPKHESCEAAKRSAGEPIEVKKRESPFKVLESLKRGSK